MVSIESAASAQAARRKRRQRWIGVAVLLVLVVGCIGLWRWLVPPARPPLDTVVVERGDLERTVTAVGSLKPKDYVDVGTQVSGQLQKVHVQIGDRVTRGDLIAEVDPTRYEAQVRNDRASLEAQRAQLMQREAELALARQQLERNRRMLVERAVSQDAVDQAESSAQVSEAAVVALKAQIKAAEATLEGNVANLGYTKVYAPMDGIVVSQTSLEGQTVNSSQQAPVIVQVANLDVMTVWARVAEADVNKIQSGMSAYFTTLGMPGRRWRGSVRQVQPTPEVTNDVVLYNVLIDVDNAELQLLPSMTVQVFFVLGEARDVPLVSMSALKRDTQAGANIYQAKVVTPDGPSDRRVEIGLISRTTAQVVSGLEVGDRVIVDAAVAAPSTAQNNRNTGPGRMMGPRL